MTSLGAIGVPTALPKMRRYRFRLKTLMLGVSICAVIVAVAVFLRDEYQNAVTSVEDSYAVSHVTDMIIYHMKTQKGMAPRNWERVKGAYQWVNSGYNMFSFVELRERVRVDFDGLRTTLKRLA